MDRLAAVDPTSLPAQQAESGGLFGISLQTLSRRRACPPPLIAEVESLLLKHIRSAGSLAAALDAAAHASMRQPLDAVCEGLNSHGAHAALADAAAVSYLAEVGSLKIAPVAILGLGVLLRLLRRLPTPAVPCELYALVIGAGPGAIATLLRKRMPPAHAAFVDALGALFSRLLLQCGIEDVAAPTTAEQERALHALFFALTPVLLRPAPEVPLPQADRTAATRATRALLGYHLHRERYRSLSRLDSGGIGGGLDGGGVGGGGMGSGVRSSGSAAAAASFSSATPPAAASSSRFAASPFTSCSPGAAACEFGGEAGGSASSSSGPDAAAAATTTPGRARGGALAMRSVASAIQQLFEREFGRAAAHAELLGGVGASGGQRWRTSSAQPPGGDDDERDEGEEDEQHEHGAAAQAATAGAGLSEAPVAVLSELEK